MPRRRHPKAEVESALAHAERLGWRVTTGGSHAWGKMYCPWNDADCRCGEFCIASIWGTPRDAGNHARQLRRIVDRCRYRRESEAAGRRDDEHE